MRNLIFFRWNYEMKMNNDHNTVWSIWLFEETGLLVNVKSDSDHYITSCRFRTAEGRQGVTAWRLFNSTSDFPVAAVASFAMDHIKQEQGRRIHLSCLRKQTNSGNLKIFLAVNVVSLICNFASRLVYSFFGSKKAAFAGWCEENCVEGNYKSNEFPFFVQGVFLVGIAQQAGAGGVGWKHT